VEPADPSGITVAPGRRLTIQFLHNQPPDVVTISLTDETDVMVRALRGGASFESGDQTLTIDNSAARGSFEILVPRAARRVEILVAGRRVFLKDDARIESEAPPQEGRYIVPLGAQ
jgi:hypothetical protein